MAAFPTSLKATDLPERIGTDYPPPFNQPCLQRSRRALGNAFGLSQFGVNLMELPPGAWSSQRHWHEREDEFVYVLEGEVDLVTDAGSTKLTAGMIAGFRAGEPNGHHLVNRSDRVARVLEVGTRSNAETAHYSDIDMVYDEVGVPEGYYRRDGSPYR
ncbi:MAG: cupin domain-containing protein [Reyranellaceae bacterium]